MTGISQKALIALGSNEESSLGDARETIQKAMLLVGQLSDKTAQSSRLYGTVAFPAGTGPDYVNACMVISTAIAAADLMQKLHQIEASANRVRTVRWGQRTLDLDLIGLDAEVYPDAKIQTQWRDLAVADQQKLTPTELIVPHPRLQDRGFVLIPMLDVAPTWQHPLTHQTIAEMATALPAEQRAEVRLLDGWNTP